jgi:sialic acid synthase SpsE
LNKNVIKFNNDPYIISEIGINHNGYLSLAKKLIKSSVLAGANAVKFQKRDVSDLVNDQSKLKKAKGYLSKNQHDINQNQFLNYSKWLEYKNHQIIQDLKIFSLLTRKVIHLDLLTV